MRLMEGAPAILSPVQSHTPSPLTTARCRDIVLNNLVEFSDFSARNLFQHQESPCPIAERSRKLSHSPVPSPPRHKLARKPPTISTPQSRRCLSTIPIATR